MALNEINKPKYANGLLNAIATLFETAAGDVMADTNGVNIIASEQQGVLVRSLVAYTDAVAPVEAAVYTLNSVGTVIHYGVISIPAGSGVTPGTPAFDILNDAAGLVGLEILPTGQKQIQLKADEILKIVPVNTDIQSGETLWVRAGARVFEDEPT